MGKEIQKKVTTMSDLLKVSFDNIESLMCYSLVNEMVRWW